ncbi:hypothetical protein B0H11DRAFT_1965167 [Mycena galericulata]|nr:hypothetical protein B0H11DRAFT_1965167 [Mycena galericulata]
MASSALHWRLSGDLVLFSFIRLDSLGGFVLGAVLTSVICALERLLTFALERHWSPRLRSHGANALWRAVLYWEVVSLRLAYMLIAMTMHIGLILVTVTTLALGQFLIELRTPRDRDSYTPLSESDTTPHSEDASDSNPLRRPRAKPDAIFIHPTQSNLARADAAALTLLGGDTTSRNGVDSRYLHADAAWEAGRGPDVARSLLGNTRSGPRRTPFMIGDDGSDAESV